MFLLAIAFLSILEIMIRRKSCRIKYLFCGLVTFLCFFTFANESIITWQTDHRPPASILKGPYQGQGFIDQIRDELITQLPQYQHKTSISPLDRLFDDMHRGKEICHPLLFVTQERMKSAYFSISATITPSMRLIINAEMAEKLNLTEPINLEQFINSSRKTFAIVKGRSYGPFIDNVLKKQNNNDTHVKISVSDNTRLFKLLEKKRVDFTFAYPFELNYYQTHGSNNNVKFSMLTILGETNYTLGSVACSKTPWGKAVIDDVNQALKMQRKKADYITTMNKWWPQETSKPAFNDFYQNVFLKN